MSGTVQRQTIPQCPRCHDDRSMRPYDGRVVWQCGNCGATPSVERRDVPGETDKQRKFIDDVGLGDFGVSEDHAEFRPLLPRSKQEATAILSRFAAWRSVFELIESPTRDESAATTVRSGLDFDDFEWREEHRTQVHRLLSDMPRIPTTHSAARS